MQHGISIACVALLLGQAARDPNGAAKEAAAVKPVAITGELRADDPRDAKRKASPAKVHAVKLTKGVAYVIDLVSTDFDAFLRIEDSQAQPLAEDDDGGGARNARLFFLPPETGEYRLIATAYQPKNGRYRLTIQEANLPSTALALNDGAGTVKDVLGPTDLRSAFSPHTNAKLYRAPLQAGTTYVIDLESADFDAYLTLANPSLCSIASDDDSGGKRNARIRFACKTSGSYFLVASGLGEPAGSFTLKVHAAK